MTNDSPPEPNPRLDHLVESILAAHRAELDADQRAMLRQHVERLRAGVATLDAYPLRNSDEPDFRFAAVEKVDAP